MKLIIVVLIFIFSTNSNAQNPYIVPNYSTTNKPKRKLPPPPVRYGSDQVPPQNRFVPRPVRRIRVKKKRANSFQKPSKKGFVSFAMGYALDDVTREKLSNETVGYVTDLNYKHNIYKRKFYHFINLNLLSFYFNEMNFDNSWYEATPKNKLKGSLSYGLQRYNGWFFSLDYSFLSEENLLVIGETGYIRSDKFHSAGVKFGKSFSAFRRAHTIYASYAMSISNSYEYLSDSSSSIDSSVGRTDLLIGLRLGIIRHLSVDTSFQSIGYDSVLDQKVSRYQAKLSLNF